MLVQHEYRQKAELPHSPVHYIGSFAIESRRQLTGYWIKNYFCA